MRLLSYDFKLITQNNSTKCAYIFGIKDDYKNKCFLFYRSQKIQN